MKYLQFIKRIFFPKRCPVCGELVEITKQYCPCSSGEKIYISNSFCTHCAQEYKRCTCGYEKSNSFSHIAAVCVYSGLARQQICELKFENGKHLAPTLANEMSERVATVFSAVDFDFICFVPSSQNTLRKRGYNQSELLARQIAKNLFIPYLDVLKKVRETSFQHNLDAEQRATNIVGSIICNGDVNGKTVLLCDDIKTTGATLKECVEALTKSGARDIYCICYAVCEYSKDMF